MAKLLCESQASGVHHSWLFECPGCKHAHSYDGRWVFNGDHRAPSFTPSLLVQGQEWNGTESVPTRCHLYVTSGKLVFLPDCTHALAGQTVPMLDWDEVYALDKFHP
jgi:hypothetical protein